MNIEEVADLLPVSGQTVHDLARAVELSGVRDKGIKLRGVGVISTILKLTDVEAVEDKRAESADFWEVEPVGSLVRSQGAPLSPRFEDLKGDFWPDDESIEDFIGFIRQLK